MAELGLVPSPDCVCAPPTGQPGTVYSPGSPTSYSLPSLRFEGETWLPSPEPRVQTHRLPQVSLSECQSPGGLREPQVSHQAGGHLGRAGWCELRVLQCSRPYSSSGVQHSAAPLANMWW